MKSSDVGVMCKRLRMFVIIESRRLMQQESNDRNWPIFYAKMHSSFIMAIANEYKNKYCVMRTVSQVFAALRRTSSRHWLTSHVQ